MKASVVILNWNTKGYLKEFLPEVIDSCKNLGEAVVADSASTDGSLEMLIYDFPDLKLIPLEKNYGFAGGYDRALRLLDSDYLVLMNSDIKIHQGWLKPLVEWMDSHPECAVCGPKIHSLKTDSKSAQYTESDFFEYAGAAGGYIDRFGFPFCRGRVMKRVEHDSGQYDVPKDVLWVSGACMMVRRTVWEELGGLDENFFAHMEEIDFCWRANLAGWKVTVVPESVVWHIGGGTLNSDSPFKLKLNFRNNLLMLRKNLPATIGRFRASSRIFFRMLLDVCAGIVYLLTFRIRLTRAVAGAHKEFMKLRKSVIVTEKQQKVTGTWVEMMKISVLPAALFKGRRIFKFLKRYEDNHSGSR